MCADVNVYLFIYYEKFKAYEKKNYIMSFHVPSFHNYHLMATLSFPPTSSLSSISILK